MSEFTFHIVEAVLDTSKHLISAVTSGFISSLNNFTELTEMPAQLEGYIKPLVISNNTGCQDHFNGKHSFERALFYTTNPITTTQSDYM
ncbi:hypothetical protein [Photobacterium alginatilyticum]|uniref:Uncharacterized protein n=1 Tax=Photobacterium alginatilyticum TaxID=1775171 RepID=A0ABW9YQ93_9GAMM|nr:hypothetical protein [Photobacterium alginatilyticum]NBI55428.1 hypothetical protein [Photobacterium alginatilyticum]